MKKLFIYVCCFYSTFTFANLSHDHKQVLLVIGENMKSTTAKMWMFEKHQDWREVGSKIDVTVGRNGFAWSRGLHGDCPKGEESRKEGSNTAPLGIYSIDSVFGLNRLRAEKSYDLPYTHFTSSIFVVDDVKSKYYNLIVDANDVEKDWDSAEDVSKIPGYKYGAVVGFNADPIDQEAGSAIFLHVWRAPGFPTAGCTAMSEKNMHKVAKWFRSSAKPVIIQLTQADYLKYKESWKLPEVAIDY